MILEITYDKTCQGWDWDGERSKLIATNAIYQLQDAYHERGYLYFNEIYELFGREWDPEKDNTVVIRKKNEIEFNLIDLWHGQKYVIRIEIK